MATRCGWLDGCAIHFPLPGSRQAAKGKDGQVIAWFWDNRTISTTTGRFQCGCDRDSNRLSRNNLVITHHRIAKAHNLPTQPPGTARPQGFQPMPPPDTPSHRFRKAEHLRLPSEFDRVYQRRRSASDPWLIVYACENGLTYLRLGLSVSRKVGQATYRTRLRRLYREAFRLTRHEMPVGLDLVVIPQRGSAEPTLAELKQSLPRLVGQLARKLAREGRPPC
jgi:ribonuclease P protein component